MTAFTLDSGNSPTWDRPADRVRTAAEQTYDRIRNNPALNSQAAEAFIAEAYVTMQQQLAALSQDAGSANTAALAQTKRAVFGIDGVLGRSSAMDQATAQIGFRDAQDRVARRAEEGGPLAIQEMFDDAETVGDEMQAQAIFNYVATNWVGGQDDIVDRFLASRPDKRAAFDTLAEMQSPSLFAADLWEFVAPTPIELGGLNEYAIQNLAARASEYRADGNPR